MKPLTKISAESILTSEMDRALLLALTIPAAFTFSMGLIKSLVRADFTWSSFYLGLDIALEALANGVVNIADMHGRSAPEIGQNSAEYVLFAIVLLFVTMVIHQRWEGPLLAQAVAGPGNRAWRGIWLGVVSNGLGTLSLLVFMLFKLRGKL